MTFAHSTDRPRVLALSGGGARALLSLQALKYLERSTGKRIHELFSLVIGTSTGALQALALTKQHPLTAAAVELAYLDMLPKVFDKRLLSFGGLAGPQYPAEPLEKALRGVLNHDLLADCLVPTAVAAYSLTARLPVLLGSYNAHAFMPAWEAARASSAAPTYFKPFGEFVDGGLCSNNPALWGVLEAGRLFARDPRDCLVLSLGTGSTEAPIYPVDAGSFGKLGWISPVLSMCMDGGEDLVDLQLSELLPAGQYLRLQTRLAGNAPGRPSPDMDDTSPENLRALQQRGNQVVAENRAAIDAFTARLV